MVAQDPSPTARSTPCTAICKREAAKTNHQATSPIPAAAAGASSSKRSLFRNEGPPSSLSARVSNAFFFTQISSAAGTIVLQLRRSCWVRSGYARTPPMASPPPCSNITVAPRRYLFERFSNLGPGFALAAHGAGRSITPARVCVYRKQKRPAKLRCIVDGCPRLRCALLGTTMLALCTRNSLQDVLSGGCQRILVTSDNHRRVHFNGSRRACSYRQGPTSIGP
ncbi:hypothetical protein S40293_11252 [Stachybotrys chartarum IBT 40293]|nr:hypothetical protein S40293_11252 [Stachybotrys chartarum IBT 40293]